MEKKKIILTFCLLAVLAGCKTKPFKGFLVCKEYVKGHMDDEQPHIHQEAIVYVPVVPPRRHEPEEGYSCMSVYHGLCE